MTSLKCQLQCHHPREAFPDGAFAPASHPALMHLRWSPRSILCWGHCLPAYRRTLPQELTCMSPDILSPPTTWCRESRCPVPRRSSASGRWVTNPARTQVSLCLVKSPCWPCTQDFKTPRPLPTTVFSPQLLLELGSCLAPQKGSDSLMGALRSLLTL